MSLLDRVLSEAKLSSAQQQYLLALVREFEKADAAEHKRWGAPLNWINEAKVAAKLGKSPEQILATGNKVIGANLVELKATAVHGSKLRLGSFGKWIGGAKRTTHISRLVRPTKAGTALAHKLATEV